MYFKYIVAQNINAYIFKVRKFLLNFIGLKTFILWLALLYKIIKIDRNINNNTWKKSEN